MFFFSHLTKKTKNGFVFINQNINKFLKDGIFMEEKNFTAICILIISLFCVAVGASTGSDGAVFSIISAVIFLLDIRYIICKEFYAAACQKGYNEKKYFWYGFFFGLIGYLLVIALPNKNN